MDRNWNVLPFFLSLLSIANSLFKIDGPPILTEEPPPLIIFKRDVPVILTCNAKSDYPITYRWVNPKMQIVSDERTLVLMNPKTEHEGAYQCEAQSPLGTAVSSKTILRMARLNSRVTDRPRNFNVPEGVSLRLRCDHPRSVPEGRLTWRYRHRYGVSNVIESNRKVIFEGNLLFTNVKREDGDREYFCVYSNSWMKREWSSSGAKLRVLPSQKTQSRLEWMAVTPSIMMSIGGKSATLMCVAASNAEVVVSWSRRKDKTKEWKEVGQSSGARVTLGGLKLTLHRVTKADEGFYQCLVKSGDRTMVRRTRLLVREPPRWINKPKDVTLTVGSTHTIRCLVSEDTKPIYIRWYINGRNEPLFKPGIIINSTALTLTNVTTKDSCVIQCNASNWYGYVFTNVVVNIVQRRAPMVLAPLPTVIVKSEGESVNLSCPAVGFPPIIHTWKMNDYVILPEPNASRQVLASGDLEIKNLTLLDTGSYTCSATNGFGKDQGVQKLVVRSRTRIIRSPADTWITEGETVKLRCSATTDPMEKDNLKLTWKKDGLPIHPSILGGVLTITSATIADSGVYTCVAKSSIDSAEATAVLSISGRPQRPGAVSVNCTNDVAKIKWKAGRNNFSPIVSYETDFSVDQDPERWYTVTKDVRMSEDSCRTPNTTSELNLHPGQKYRFRVRARNKFGLSGSSDIADGECQTRPERPATNPSEVSVNGTEDGKLAIRWKPLTVWETNGESFRYVITVRCLNCSRMSSDIRNTIKISDYKASSLILSAINLNKKSYRLERGCLYEVSIQASNIMGMSQQMPFAVQGKVKKSFLNKKRRQD